MNKSKVRKMFISESGQYGVEISQLIDFDENDIGKYRLELWNSEGSIKLYLHQFEEIKKIIESEVNKKYE